MFDVVIAGGTVVDGSGSAGYRTDVGIAGEKIEALGDLAASGARRVIDARGVAVSPDFIDTHTHLEGALLVDHEQCTGVLAGQAVP